MQSRIGIAVAGLAGLALAAPCAAQGKGTIYVSRDETLVSALMSTDIAVDSKVMGSVANGGCIKLSVPAGTRVIGAPSFIFGLVRESATIKVAAGSQIFVKAIPKMEWPGPVHWAAMVVTPKGRRC
jgi:hypothetical protein